MLNEELKDQILHTKLTFLNGYLMSMGLLNSYSIVGLRCKLFAFHFSNGDIEKCVQHNAYELFGVHSNEWQIEIVPAPDWEHKLKAELNASTWRRIPGEGAGITNKGDYRENDLTRDYVRSTQSVNEHFVRLLKNEFVDDATTVHELRVVQQNATYRLVGIDLIFEIAPGKILFLQVLGVD